MPALTVTPRARRLLPLAFGAAIVVGTIAVVGTGPLLRGLAAISPAAIAAAALLNAAATAAAAWRWRAVSRELGLPLPWREGVAAYYRSQFVNSVLPGGVIGDVHRAYRHGAPSGDLATAARAVATERITGQLVQAAATAIVLAALGLTASRGGWPPSVVWSASAAVGLIVAALVAAAVIAVATPGGRRILTRELSLLGRVFRAPRSSISIVLASLVVVAAHAGTFVVACLAVGIRASPGEFVGLALVALAAGSLPVNIGGWGPREAASAAAFAAIGLSAGAGVAASTAFGVLAIVAVLPGALALIVDRVFATRPLHPLPEENPA